MPFSKHPLSPQNALLLLVLCVLALTGCAAKKGEETGRFEATAPDSARCADLARLPQDLLPYAQKAGMDRVLLSPEEQSAHAEKTRRRFFQPWRVTTPSASLRKSLQNNFSLKQEKGFTDNLRQFTDEAWAALVENADAANYPSRSEAAVTVRNSSLRAMPTTRPYFINPDQAGEGYPFDYFQHTALWIGTPVFISHVSKDGNWVLAQTWISTGWLPAEDVAAADEAFQNRWQSLPLAAVIKDDTPIQEEHGAADAVTGRHGAARAHIGALFPTVFTAAEHGKQQGLRILFPKRAQSGKAEIGIADLGSGEAAIFPLPLTPGAIARVGNEMMGQPYGWGGLFENRDCSALTRDLFIPFGLFMPRNSLGQGKWGAPIDLAGLEPDEKDARIMNEAPAFFSLVWMRGHIGLYLGAWDGKPVMFHNIWGLRINKTGPDGVVREGRSIIGKAVVTTLRPGAELPEIAHPAGLLARIERISVLPETEKKPEPKAQKSTKRPTKKAVAAKKAPKKPTFPQRRAASAEKR